VSGSREPRLATDRAVVDYCLGVTVLLAISGRGSGLPLGPRIAEHLVIAVLVIVAARLDRGAEGSAARWLHRWLPMIALPWLYAAAGELRRVIVGRDFDALVAGWDAALFPGEWYRVGARLPDVALELAHAAYASYYLLLFVPALLAERRRPREVERYLFWVVATLLAHYALNFLFPVHGPSAHGELAERGWLFVPAMNAVYLAFDRGGLAFPSTHVAASLLAAAFAARLFPRRRPLFALWFGLVAASTVVCGYHYPIDVPAGMATGGLAWALARRGSGTASAAGADRAAAS
jgi:membrane-associated phospholipid phosphatase